jgi:hypothetical protein
MPAGNTMPPILPIVWPRANWSGDDRAPGNLGFNPNAAGKRHRRHAEAGAAGFQDMLESRAAKAHRHIARPHR